MKLQWPQTSRQGVRASAHPRCVVLPVATHGLNARHQIAIPHDSLHSGAVGALGPTPVACPRQRLGRRRCLGITAVAAPERPQAAVTPKVSGKHRDRSRGARGASLHVTKALGSVSTRAHWPAHAQPCAVGMCAACLPLRQGVSRQCQDEGPGTCCSSVVAARNSVSSAPSRPPTSNRMFLGAALNPATAPGSESLVHRPDQPWLLTPALLWRPYLVSCSWVARAPTWQRCPASACQSHQASQSQQRRAQSSTSLVRCLSRAPAGATMPQQCYSTNAEQPAGGQTCAVCGSADREG